MNQLVKNMTKKNYYAALFVIISSLKLFYTPLITSDVFIWTAAGLKSIANRQLDLVDSYSIHHGLEILYPSHLSNILYGVLFLISGHWAIFIFSRVLGLLFLIFLQKKYFSLAPLNVANLVFVIFVGVGCFFMLDRPAYLIYLLATFVFGISITKGIENSFDQNLFKNSLVFYLLVALWTNLHPSALILLPILAIQFLAFQKKQTFCYGIASLLGILSTPIGLKIWNYAILTMSMSSKRKFFEWLPIYQYPSRYYQILFFLLLAAFLWRVTVTKSWIKFLKTGLFIFIPLSFFNSRHVVFFFLTLIPLSSYLNLWIPAQNSSREEESQFKRKWITVLIFATLNIALLIGNYSQTHLFDEDANVEVAEFLKSKKDLRVFNDIEPGYLEIVLAPNNIKIFFDARNIIFPDQVFHDYVEIIRGNNVERILDNYSVDTIIVRKKNVNLLASIQKTLKWLEVFQNKDVIIFQRR